VGVPLNCNLKHFLIDLDMSQTQLAKITGISRTTISLLANGVTEPSLETALIIAEALGKPVEAIWTLKRPEP
jgi:DNA-binding XRE family transcriptional regulator